jgi:hypothetical protein
MLSATSTAVLNRIIYYRGITRCNTESVNAFLQFSILYSVPTRLCATYEKEAQAATKLSIFLSVGKAGIVL